MSIIPREKLDSWANNHKNVMLIGAAGVGKTGIVRETWDRHGLRYLYYSASTMDPFIDFIGIPKEQEDIHPVTGKKISYIELVPPKPLAFDEVDAIFFDEYNRAPEKVRNATMELIQFKTINGRKFSNLKMIWIAINPEDTGEYDVQALDPAQKDRFHIHWKMPYRPDHEYFTNKFGDNGDKLVNWWHKLPDEAKLKISPRRLDYAGEMFLQDGDISDILGEDVSSEELVSVLNHGTIEDRLKKLMDNPNTTEHDKKKFIQNDNNFQHMKPILTAADAEADKIFSYFVKHIEPERAVALMADDIRLADKFAINAGLVPNIIPHVKDTILPLLMPSMSLKLFNIIDEFASKLDEEEAQPKIFNKMSENLNKGGINDPNKVYHAAYALKTSKTKWPKVCNTIEYSGLNSVVVKGLDIHSHLKDYFK